MQGEQQVLLLSRGLHHSGIGQDDGGVFVASSHAVDHDTIQHTRLEVFLLHVEIGVGDAVVEDAFRYFQLRALLLHGNQQLCERHVCPWAYDVLEIE